MKIAEILRQYAEEDLKILIENGCMAITDTVYKFPLFLDFDGKTFKATKNDGTVLIETKRKSLIRSFIENSYLVA